MSTQRRPKGTGGIRNRGSKRTPRWVPYYHLTEAGDRRQVGGPSFGRKADAERWLAERVAEVDRGRAVAPSRVTVGEMLDEWMMAAAPAYSDNTRDEHERRIRTRLKPALGSIRLDELRAQHVTRMMHDLRQPGSNLRDPSARIGETSIQHIYGTLRTAVGWAVRHRYVLHNVVEDVDRPKRDASDVEVWTATELASLFRVIDVERLMPFFRLAAFTGARRSELLALLWASVSLDDATVAISRKRIRSAGQMVEVETTKSQRGRRVIDVDAGTVAVLRQWATVQKIERLEWGPAYQGAPNVFTTADGDALHADQVSKTWDRLRGKGDGGPLHLHGLRHTHASLLLAQGVPVVDVAYRLGDTIETVMSTYAHFIPGRGPETAELFAAMVDRVGGVG